MYSKFKIRSITTSLVVAAATALFMGSCTIYKYADPASEDGIYASRGAYRGNANDYSQTSSYYKQYFQSKRGTYSDILEDQEYSALFTDIDAYNTKEYLGDDGYIYTERVNGQEEAYGGYGQNATSISINMYNNGGYGGYSPWGYNSFYGNWGYPYAQYGYGYRPWSFGIGFGFGFGWGGSYGGYYSPYYSPYYYHGGYYGGYYGNYYNRPHYNNVSYNRGRRNTDYSGRNNSGYSNQTNVNRGRTSNSINSQEGRRSSNYNNTRESSIINSTDGGRRGSSINSNSGRQNTSTNYNTDRGASTQSRRVTFPQSSNNSTTPIRTQQQPTRRQSPASTRPVQTRQDNQSYNTNRNSTSPNMRSSSPTRSPSMQQSAPSRSSAPASRGRSGGGRR